MNESSYSQIQELLDRSETVGVVVGKNPSVDEMGAALALYLSLQSIGKKVSVASVTEPNVALSSLVGIDKVKDSFEAQGGDLIVSFPYREGEIDKVSYTLEEGSLNIVVKPGELGLNFTESDVVFKRKGDYPGIIFTVGVPRISDLSSVFDIAALKDTLIINIDNKAENQGYGDLAIIHPESSSVSEQVAKIINSLGIQLDMDIAQNLLSGILSATNNFQTPNTTAMAFEMAGMLMAKGAVRKNMSNDFEERPYVSQNPGRVLENLSRMQENKQKRFDNRNRNFPQKRQPQNQPIQNQPVQNNQPVQTQDVADRLEDNQNPPEEWFTPKVYKGSTNV